MTELAGATELNKTSKEKNQASRIQVKSLKKKEKEKVVRVAP